MKTGVIYIANNGEEFHDAKNAAAKDFELRLIALLEEIEQDGQKAWGITPNLSKNPACITLLKCFVWDEKRNRRALRRAWFRYVSDIEKYQRDSEGGGC